MHEWTELPFVWEQALKNASQNGDERPTWAYDWPAGQRMAADLSQDLHETVHLKDATVLDLGCGRGQLGREALHLGAEHVVFADASHAVLDYLDGFIEANSISHKAETWHYRWGEQSDRSFDIILGGDICYRPECYAELLKSISQCLTKQGCAWLSDPRYTLEDSFSRLVQENGLHVVQKRMEKRYTLLQLQHA